MSKDFVTSIDRAVREHTADNPEPRRGHVGASAIGGRCARQVWYGFRWAYNEQHTGRILRLFSRGHEEEHRFNRWLRMAGVEVQDYDQRLCYDTQFQEYLCVDWDLPINPNFEDVSEDPHHIALATAQWESPKQWGFTDFQGHFRGSSDGRMRAGPDCRLTLPEGWGLIEEKTHNDKSFKQLTAKGVLTSKPTHYVQMQIYMHYMDLKWAFYYSVNKNDDTLYVEIVYYREEIAMPYIASACKIIEAKSPPKKLTEDPSWFECKFCAFREVCHYGDAPQKNCRSCVFAEPVLGGEWRCNKHEAVIPKDFITQGCKDWEPIG
jgi:hypothetical protein